MAAVAPAPEAASAPDSRGASPPRGDAARPAPVDLAEGTADGRALPLEPPRRPPEALPEGIVIPRPSQLHPSSDAPAPTAIDASPGRVVMPARAVEGRLPRLRRRVLRAVVLIALAVLVIGGAVLATLAVSWLLTQ